MERASNLKIKKTTKMTAKSIKETQWSAMYVHKEIQKGNNMKNKREREREREEKGRVAEKEK